MDDEVKKSRIEYGANILSVKKSKSFAKRFLSNLGDPIIKILIGALVINIIFMFRDRDFIESAGIAVSVFLATFISTLSEHGSETAFARLSESYSGGRCRVVRKGEITELDIGEIVVGDIVMLSAGEQIPADGEIIDGEITVDQSSMTGESREVTKRVRRKEDGDSVGATSPYCILRGCTLLSGNAVFRVTAVGDSTALGGVSREVQSETRESPLKLRLAKLARQISVFGYIAAILIALVYLFNVLVVDSAFDTEIIKYKLTSFDFLAGHLMHALTLGLTVIVVAVPEGLPMMIAVVLSSNIKRMVKDNVLVRKPVGIEAAGSMNILFSDKTGTLTEGKLSLGSIYTGNGMEFASSSELKKSSRVIYDALALGSVLNNSSSIVKGSDKKSRAVGGNSTDRALLDAFARIGVEYTSKYRKTDEIPFDSERKFSAAQAVTDREKRIFIKGAPEKILPCVVNCLSADGSKKGFDRKIFEKLCNKCAAEGKRVIVLAESDGRYSRASYLSGNFGKLCLVAAVILEDKIRSEASASVEKLSRAGIQVVMITGDNKKTAEYIAKSCGIMTEDRNIALTSAELSLLSDDALKRMLPRIALIARALPSDKSRLVRISQELELVVGMTGDGINDAPALKRADIGFSMGSGTQVAKDAGDIIILDDNLASVVNSVLYGRTIFKSIRKFITLQLMMNFCAVGVSMICPFLGVDAPVTVVQMLWINIIMDTLGGLAFAGEKPLSSYMEERPKRRDEPILNGYMVNQILLQGGFTIALCIAFLKLPEIIAQYRYSADNIYLLTAFFALFIFSSVFNCFGARTDRLKIFSGISGNRGFVLIMLAVLFIQILFVYLGGAVLRTAPLTAWELCVCVVAASAVIPAELIRKLLWRFFRGKKGY